MLSNYPNGFAGGVTIRRMPVLNSYPASVRWVDSNGSQNGDGSFKRPYSTIQKGIDACDASKGDIVMVKAGHAETIADATTLTINKAGVGIVGLGQGGTRPTLTFTTATTANIPVSAANCSVQNILHVANFADIASYYTLAAAKDFQLRDCEFRDTSSILNCLTVVTTGSTANAADGLAVIGNRVSSLGTTAATTMVVVGGTQNRLTINDNFFVGAVLNNTAALLAHTNKVVTNLEMARNRVFRPNTDTATGGILITTSATTNTGMVYDNYVVHADVAGAILVTAGCNYGTVNNLTTGDADSSGYVLPAIGTN